MSPDDIDLAISGNAQAEAGGAPYQAVLREIVYAWHEVMAGRCPLHRDEVLRRDRIDYSDGSSNIDLVCPTWGFDFFALPAYEGRKARLGMGLFRDTQQTRAWYEDVFLAGKRRKVANAVARVKAVGPPRWRLLSDSELERLVLTVLVSE